MTDLPPVGESVLHRLNTRARADGDGFALIHEPVPATCHLGSVRISLLTYMVDVVGGVSLDTDPDMWTFTSDLDVWMRPVPAPTVVEASSVIIRGGTRSATCSAPIVDGDGRPLAYSVLGFARVPRRAGDPPKGVFDIEDNSRFRGPAIDIPLRDAAGIRVLDGPAGVVEIEVLPALQNPAGALQGAMVGLTAEIAAEELASARLGAPALITELSIRYLKQCRTGPVRSRCQWLGDRPDSPIKVELWDVTTDDLLVHAVARAADAMGGGASGGCVRVGG